jgi:translation initiation factor 1 (eIF-1/SUI1)
LDEDSAEKSRRKTYPGKVPHVQIKAAQMSNKKATFITNLELFQLDINEFVLFLSKECSFIGNLHTFETKKG